MKTSTAIWISVAVGGVGIILGIEAEKIRNYETWVYPISLYSSHLHELADHQNITQLTNDIILFDNKFNTSQGPHIPYDVMVQILRKRAIQD